MSRIFVVMNFNRPIVYSGSIMIAAKDNGFVAFGARAEDILV